MVMRRMDAPPEEENIFVAAESEARNGCKFRSETPPNRRTSKLAQGG
jgi:hypothetical protein